MNWTPRLEKPVLQQLEGLPGPGFDAFVDVVARICTDPYDRLVSKPSGMDPRLRMAELGDGGFIEFVVDDAAGLVQVLRLVWVG